MNVCRDARNLLGDMLINALLSADRDATDYFRGIVKSGEMSPRVLELTEHIIRQNPAHYSAWYASNGYWAGRCD